MLTTRDSHWEWQLDNWGRWRGGSSIASAMSPERLLLGGVQRGELAQEGVRILNGDALDIDTAFQLFEKTDRPLADAVRFRYVHPEWGERMWARRCGIGRTVYFDRLKEGKERLRRGYLVMIDTRRQARGVAMAAKKVQATA
jgi:hypothetical protein